MPVLERTGREETAGEAASGGRKKHSILADAMEAVIAAGATRLRPVLLTAVTTILGLIPMVTGVSFDFHSMSISWVSESSQWWRSMAVVVIFGLMVATFLTLVVVPVLYFLIERSKELLAAGWKWYLRKRIEWYWVLTGEKGDEI